jgi:hypothetical protein
VLKAFKIWLTSTNQNNEKNTNRNRNNLERRILLCFFRNKSYDLHSNNPFLNRTLMKKLINFIESEWSRPAIVCFAVFLFFFFAFFLSLADKRETNRIETQTQSWKDQGYPIGE